MSESRQRYFLCVSDGGYSASLQPRTVYVAVSDPEGESHGMLRIVDESGEDYLFPASLFVPIEVPESAARAFVGAA
jgi:hypothetical protein